ncbi:uncharacterized protein LOC142592537 isoform X1 [Dermacentor variabilis]|uniref:uncharacterized protein LOC142592537 isoform X1 n=1 Tax=Dermacentor variabilis TaxID=34621 RepID=UPI003F5BC345
MTARSLLARRTGPHVIMEEVGAVEVTSVEASLPLDGVVHIFGDDANGPSMPLAEPGNEGCDHMNEYDLWVADDSTEWDLAGDHNYNSDPNEGSSFHRAEAGTPRDATNWSHAEVLLLIASYQRHILDFHDRKKKRKHIWIQISTEMRERGYLRTASDCDTKFKGLKRTYDKHRQHKRKSGRDRKEWPFYREMENLLSSSAEYQAPISSSMPTQPSTSATSPGGVQLLGPAQETRGATGENTDGFSDERCSQHNAAQVAAKAKRRKTPATLLQDILSNMEAWQDEERQRYKQQLKMQRMKLKMLKRIVSVSVSVY